MWVWVLVALGVIGVLAAAAAGAMFMKGGAEPEPTVPDFSNLILDDVDNPAQVMEPEMQILEQPEEAM